VSKTICQIPQAQQQKFKNKITEALKRRNITDVETELSMALNSRLCDIEGLLQ